MITKKHYKGKIFYRKMNLPRSIDSKWKVYGIHFKINKTKTSTFQLEALSKVDNYKPKNFKFWVKPRKLTILNSFNSFPFSWLQDVKSCSKMVQICDHFWFFGTKAPKMLMFSSTRETPLVQEDMNKHICTDRPIVFLISIN